MKVLVTVQFAGTARFEYTVPDDTDLEHPSDEISEELLNFAETFRADLKFDRGLWPLEKKEGS